LTARLPVAALRSADAQAARELVAQKIPGLTFDRLEKLHARNVTLPTLAARRCAKRSSSRSPTRSSATATGSAAWD
jgi:hypothetical protein